MLVHNKMMTLPLSKGSSLAQAASLLMFVRGRVRLSLLVTGVLQASSVAPPWYGLMYGKGLGQWEETSHLFRLLQVYFHDILIKYWWLKSMRLWICFLYGSPPLNWKEFFSWVSLPDSEASIIYNVFQARKAGKICWSGGKEEILLRGRKEDIFPIGHNCRFIAHIFSTIDSWMSTYGCNWSFLAYILWKLPVICPQIVTIVVFCPHNVTISGLLSLYWRYSYK